MANKVVSATEFKSKCFALLDEVEEKSLTITVTRRGKAITKLAPVKKKAWKSLEGIWADKAPLLEELLDKTIEWNCVRESRRGDI
jgi:prevent-host-death family protein